MFREETGAEITWPSNCQALPGNLCATWDASYQPPLWVATSATWIFNTAADQVADYWWIINPCRLPWISLVALWSEERQTDSFTDTGMFDSCLYDLSCIDLWTLVWISNGCKWVNNHAIFFVHGCRLLPEEWCCKDCCYEVYDVLLFKDWWSNSRLDYLCFGNRPVKAHTFCESSCRKR